VIASLAMYDFGPAVAANDRFWSLIRDGLRAAGQPAPERLTRGPEAYWPTWEDPALTLSQTCSLPFRAALHHRVTYVCTPDYGVEGCPPGHYRSIFVARKGDPREGLAQFDGACFAYNEDHSQSGWAGPQAHLLGLVVRPGRVLATGGHRLSAQAVAEGTADLACIDAVTWRLMQRCDPVVAKLKTLGTTAPSPGLPLIAGPGANAEALYQAVVTAFSALSPEDRAVLQLQGFVRLPVTDYLALPNPAPPDQFVQPA
jgi:ABC-type phosphate/phosphonate transport system substrate-binding protein